MEDLGAPISYLTVAEGVPVYASDGREVGKVAHVLADADVDVFDGLVISSGGIPPAHRFVDADQVAALHERGVVLAIDSELAEHLPRPSANPAAVSAGPDDTVPDELRDKLRRAWDRISGKE
ncbi:MAG TPA: PRC-barrel domain-containing protein [Candidatus Limnocylindrales bacterium]|nr:PRC-barrel domain-containing protein [Candidatus Limnocylindrales bacterium]